MKKIAFVFALFVSATLVAAQPKTTSAATLAFTESTPMTGLPKAENQPTAAAGGTKPGDGKIKLNMKQKISFKRDGLTLVGDLFTPENFDEKGHYKAIIVEGSFTSVKEQMPDTYAQKFANNGFVVLAFDYSHYGESEGQPRQMESPATKTSDLQAAVSYLLSLPYVQAVGMVGVCTSAGNAAYLAAADPRVKAIATVAGFMPDPALMKGMLGEAEITRRRAAAVAAERKYRETGVSDVVKAYSETDPTASSYIPMLGAFDYYLNTKRGNVPTYKNESAVLSAGTVLDFDPLSQGPLVRVPTMVVHSDESAFPDQIKKFYASLKGEKELVWGDGNHYDYYDSPAQINNAVKNVTRYFNAHLN